MATSFSNATDSDLGAITKLNFFQIPKNVRDTIYGLVLLPGAVPRITHKNTPRNPEVEGCADLFVLNRQIHAEALRVLDAIPAPYLYLWGTGRSIFRHPHRLWPWPQPDCPKMSSPKVLFRCPSFMACPRLSSLVCEECTYPSRASGPNSIYGSSATSSRKAVFSKR